MRLTWLANAPWANYGYGQQTALFAPRINKTHPTAVIANYGHEGNPILWNGVQIFGKSFHPWGMDIMHSHSATWKADALVTMMDIQVFEPDGLLGTRWIPWYPVDHITIPPAIFDRLKYSFARITMSKHASGEMDKTGMEYYYVPCGVDTKIFKPLGQVESREELKLPADKFMVGMVAANKGNPSRKAFQQNITAFAALQKKHKDCVLYLHTIDGADGRGVDTMDLPNFCRAIGLTFGYFGEENLNNYDVIFANQYGLALGYAPEMMAQLYSSMDVHTLVTMGEGFGIPIIEAQACGTPVIVGNWTSCPELCFSGWKVDKADAEMIYTNMQAFQMLPHPGAIAEKMEAAYQMRGNQDYRHRALAGAQLYDADRIMERYWLPVLEKIEAKLQEKQPDNLAQNLDMLR